MKRRIYVSPSANRKSGYPNRYFVVLKENLAEYFDVLDSGNEPYLTQGWALLKHSFKADIFLLSFVETIAFHKLAFIQYLMVLMSFWVMRLRRGRIVFIFHNPRPHKGENWMSRSLTRLQLTQSCLVVSHSCETAAFARALLSEYGCSPDKVRYICHPIVDPSAAGSVVGNASAGAGSSVSAAEGASSFGASDVGLAAVSASADSNAAIGHVQSMPGHRGLNTASASTDHNASDEVLIWGNILPYKGVLEFVSSPAVRTAGLNVRIVGRCKDASLAAAIEKAVGQCNAGESAGGFVSADSGSSESVSACLDCSKDGESLGSVIPDAVTFHRTRIVFENRAADFEELAVLIRSSRHVLFPYLPGSVSSSGVLMDTLSMGGNPVGPAIGAFADLARENVCDVYGSEAEMIEILKSDRRINPETLRSFIARNSWQAYAKFFADFFAVR